MSFIQNLLSDDRDPIVWWAAMPRAAMLRIDPEDAPPFKMVGEVNADPSAIGQLTTVAGAWGRALTSANGKLVAIFKPRAKPPTGYTGAGTLTVVRVLKGSVVLPTLAFGGSGTLSAIATQAAAFNASGTLSYSGYSVKMVLPVGFTAAGTASVGLSYKTTMPTLAYSGAGTLTVVHAGGQVALAGFGGAGTSTVFAASKPATAFGASGDLATVALSRAAASFFAAGEFTLVFVPKAVFALDYTGEGTLTAEAKPLSVKMGVDKSGTQLISSTSTWTKITNWTVRSGYPETIVSVGSELQMYQGKYDLAAKATITSNNRMKMRFTVNGSQIGNPIDPGTTAATSVSGLLGSVQLNGGDLVAIEVQPTASRTVSAGSANTYLTADITPSGAKSVSMYKSPETAANLPTGTSATIPLWLVADGFPSTDLYNNGMRLAAGKYVFLAGLAWTSSSVTTLRVMVNSTEVASIGTGGGGGTSLSLTSPTVTVLDGDVVTMQAVGSSARAITAGPSTYLSATAIANPVPMGMYYTGTGGTNSNGTWEKTAGWTAMAARTGTVITDDSLIWNSTSKASVSAKITRAGSDSEFSVRIVVDGVVKATSVPGGSSQTVPWTGIINAGQKVWIEHYTGSPGVTNRPVQTGESNTYITIDPVPLVAMGANKTTNQTPPATNTYFQLTGWTARSGYSSTVITDHGLTLDPGSYNFEVQIRNASSTWDYHKIQLRSGSTVLWTSAVVQNGSGTASVFTVPALSVPGTDPITVWSSVQDGEIISATGTFVTATPVT